MGFWTDFLGFGGSGNDGNSGNVQQVRNLKPEILPTYPEAEGARGTWWDTLKQWQSQPGYGAIQPNWNDIWENARQKIQRYFHGGPEGPGVISNVKSNLAQRGMSDNPASENLIGRLGMQESNQLQDIAVKMAMEEAMLGEQGREKWLNSIQNLASLKPTYWWNPGSDTISYNTSPSLGAGMGDIFGALGGNVLSGGGSGFDWLDNLLGINNNGNGIDTILGEVFNSSKDTGIGDIASLFGGSDANNNDDDWWQELVKLIGSSAGAYFGGPAGAQAGYSAVDTFI